MDLTTFLVGAGVVGVTAALGLAGRARSRPAAAPTPPKPARGRTRAAQPKADTRPQTRQSKPTFPTYTDPARQPSGVRRPTPPRPPVATPHGGVPRGGARDRIALIAFHERGFVVMRPATLDDPRIPERFQTLKSKIDGMGTNITDGLRKAVDLAAQTPKGRRRRIILLSDGEANREIHGLQAEVERARENWINIDCIAFGPDAPRDVLERIARGTHNGRMIAVNSLRGLSDALARSHAGGANRTGAHKPQTTVYCIDASISMRMPMAGENGLTRIDVVQECLFRDLVVKQQAFA